MFVATITFMGAFTGHPDANPCIGLVARTALQ